MTGDSVSSAASMIAWICSMRDEELPEGYAHAGSVCRRPR